MNYLTNLLFLLFCLPFCHCWRPRQQSFFFKKAVGEKLLARTPTTAKGILLLLFGLPIFGFGQTPDTIFLEKKFEIEVAARAAVVDNLGQIYVISRANTFEKYAPDGQFLARYSQNRLGRAAFADVSNPLKIMLFYPDFRSVVLLDRNLTELGILDLEAVGLPMVSCVATSGDGNLWVYDEVNFQLKKISAAGEILMESQPLNFLLDQPARPVLLRENENSVFLCDAEMGIFQFDLYGQFVGIKFLENNLETAQFENGRVLFFENNKLIGVDLKTGERTTTTYFSKTLPQLEGLVVSGAVLMQITDDQISVFQKP